jgi:hypothetical protein
VDKSFYCFKTYNWMKTSRFATPSFYRHAIGIAPLRWTSTDPLTGAEFSAKTKITSNGVAKFK